MAPLYTQIERDLVEKINRGELLPDHAIPTELELCDLYGVSRITVRRAVERLVSARMIYRRRGVGTFVCRNDETARSLTLTGYMRDVLTFDQKLTAKILSSGPAHPPPTVREAFGVAPGDQLHAILAINFLGRHPYAVTNSFFARELSIVAGDIKLRDGKTSLRYIEELAGIRVRSGKQTIEPIVARGVLASRLDIKPGRAILSTVRSFYADGPMPIEVVQVFYHPERYVLHVELIGSDRFESEGPI